MSLGDRLRQVIKPAGAPHVAPARGADDSAVESRSVQVVRSPRIDGHRVANVLAGQWIESANGSVVVVDRYYAADRAHGRQRIGPMIEALETGGDALQVLARAWPGRELRTYGPRLCFFDLETTGLAGGAGTQAFLVGCAIVEDGGLRIRQFLLPGFEHERALLASVAEFTASLGTLVSFNGRSFDAPLVETRYLLHRLAFPLADLPH